MKFGNTRHEGSIIPAMSATPDYSAGDSVGGVQTLHMNGGNGGRGLLNQMSIIDIANQKPQLTILFFKDLPTGTYTDNGAIAPSAADIAAFLGKLEVATTDWTTIGNYAYCTIYTPFTLVGKQVAPSAGDVAQQKFNCYFVVVADATYNAGSVADLNFGFGELLD